MSEPEFYEFALIFQCLNEEMSTDPKEDNKNIPLRNLILRVQCDLNKNKNPDAIIISADEFISCSKEKVRSFFANSIEFKNYELIPPCNCNSLDTSTSSCREHGKYSETHNDDTINFTDFDEDIDFSFDGDDHEYDLLLREDFFNLWDRLLKNDDVVVDFLKDHFNDFKKIFIEMENKIKK